MSELYHAYIQSDSSENEIDVVDDDNMPIKRRRIIDDYETTSEISTINFEDIDSELKISSTIRLQYAASKILIFKLADKLEGNEVPREITLHQKEVPPQIPTSDTWDFRLGDWVRIKYPLKEFKTIQSSTLGWNGRLRTIHGRDAIVTERWSRFQNGVTIYTPSCLTSSTIYAGLLEKIPVGQNVVDSTFATRWKPDEYVTTIMDRDVIRHMQMHLEEIPQRFLGINGRIIAVTRRSVIVTFNEKTSFHINPYLLIRCRDDVEITEQDWDSPRGYILGEEVKLSENVVKLRNNQNSQDKLDCWSEEMSRLAGKTVRIIHICKDGKRLRVQHKLGGHWLISQDSVSKLQDSNVEDDETGTEFKPGDIVKIKIPENIRSILRKQNVPIQFLEYLRSTAKVRMVDDNMEYLIRFCANNYVNASMKSVISALTEEREHHERIRSMERNVLVGSRVCLDCGPPGLVKEVLKEAHTNADIVTAMTTSSTLVGFADDNRAVIELENGKRYKIKKKFLTAPEKFNVANAIDGLNIDTCNELQKTVKSCVERLCGDADDVSEPVEVKILSVSIATIPYVDLRVIPATISCAKLRERLSRDYGWKIQSMGHCDALFYVSGLKSSDQEIKVSLYYTAEPHHSALDDIKPTKTKDSFTPVSAGPTLKVKSRLVRHSQTDIHDVTNQQGPSASANTARPEICETQKSGYLIIRDKASSQPEKYVPYYTAEQSSVSTGPEFVRST